MRRYVQGILMTGVALGLIGCGATRAPQSVIAPTYSYLRADASAVTGPATTLAEVKTQQVAVADPKLPPIPAAPGFDVGTYVLAPTAPIAPFGD